MAFDEVWLDQLREYDQAALGEVVWPKSRLGRRHKMTWEYFDSSDPKEGRSNRVPVSPWFWPWVWPAVGWLLLVSFGALAPYDARVWPPLYLRHPQGITAPWVRTWSVSMLIYGVFMVASGASAVGLSRRWILHPALEAVIGVLGAGAGAVLPMMLLFLFV